MISLMFVGHLYELLLASAALATSFVSVTGFNALMGMSSVLNTFCGQSYEAQEYEMSKNMKLVFARPEAKAKTAPTANREENGVVLVRREIKQP
ncbi:hypothetical protein Lal_00026654 [Lupinus albus]|nr:hypothetical protein Lal_00026654 [Lupinus albus]